ncbi:inhibitor of nuclear factor kappa-B kinase subunit epsilon isoform X2 [Protopterus annectens]|uniref:inhibitor of nuclear factor kappa-B kinase subunit epsilon isoform X2 n=1 Tax=Protopterus annectens TaxID=7888 RepID=UPI001CFBEC59|nr:inhibitor of nuclear factor kappa-B kinase subunit epsilon isoform X2 [Protopterus annectens]
MMLSTPNYLWFKDDVLGNGATACVYKARNKGATNQKVLVMEYCSGGSLLNVLEEPQNAYGLSESEFLTVLQSVVAGMNHLRENAVVHRDIKPGNIMRLVGEDGQSIYKLTDFGAARELDDDEKFYSLYGTEEYLHPDMYERAVLRIPQQKAYGVTVDLWSIGVTFYHAATGSLPFIPFGGPRRNKETMYKLTTEKPPKAIAGVQKRENGPTEWSFELPGTCRLSAGLKNKLVHILANILEADQKKCWGFDQFFAEANDILHRIVIYVFSLQQATTHKIYIHSYNTTQIFLEEVYKQTKIPVERQEYFFDGHPYYLEPILQAQNFPKTTETSCLFLVSTSFENPIGFKYKDPDFPSFPPKYDPVADFGVAKAVVNAVYQTIRITKSLLLWQHLVLQGLFWIIENVKGECSKTSEKIKMLSQKTKFFWSVTDKVIKLYHCIDARNTTVLELKMMLDATGKIPTMHDSLTRSSDIIQDMSTRLGQLLGEFVKNKNLLHGDQSIQRMEYLLDKTNVIFKQFRKDKQQPRLSYNDEQIHKFDKINLGQHARKLSSLFHNECLPKYQGMFDAHSLWMRTVFEIKKELKMMNKNLACFSEDLERCQESVCMALEKLQRIYPENAKGPPSLPAQPNDDLILRMKQLKHEMEVVTHELQLNNSIIEGCAPFSSGLL